MTIGSRIRSAREAAHVTQDELGRACNVTKQTIFKYENGIITNIPLDKVKLIASYLSVSPAYLTGWPDEKKKPTLDTEDGHNTIRIAGRDGRLLEKRLTDEQLNALIALVDQLPEATDL